MKVEGFHYQVEVRVEFTIEEIDRLIEVGRTHYDGVCLDAVNCGGFIYGWKNYIEISRAHHRDQPAVVNANFRELDTAAKIMEQSVYTRSGNEAVDGELITKLTATLHSINAEWERVNCQQTS